MSEGADGMFHVQVSNGFSQIFSPERAIHASLAILLAVCTFFASLRVCLCDVQVYQTANGIEANYDTLVDLLESIEHFLLRIDITSSYNRLGRDGGQDNHGVALRTRTGN